MSRSRTTIRDVAALAGVSHQTVSRVINESEQVRPATRAKVAEAIAHLGYQPNAVAQSMATGTTAMLACLAPNLLDYTFASIIEGAQAEARLHGYFLLATSAPDEAGFDALVEELLTSGRTEGLMVIDPYVSELARRVPTDYPLVFAAGGAHINQPLVNTVVLDDETAALMATRHLLELGHRRVAMVTGPQTEICTQKRRIGFERALHGQQIPVCPDWIWEGDWSAASGYHTGLALLAGTERPTAVFVQNDQMAVGLLQAAREHGLQVPQSLSVIGVDDIPLAPHLWPPLTTMRQDFQRIGREAIRLLLATVADPNTPREHVRLPATLIMRESTAPYVPTEQG